MPTYYSPRGFMGPPSSGAGGFMGPLSHAPSWAAPHIVLGPERYRFMAWNGMAMQAVSNWAEPGFRLCADAEALGQTMPLVTLHLVSSTRGWFSQLGGTAQEWFNFLSCQNVEPWKHGQLYGQVKWQVHGAPRGYRTVALPVPPLPVPEHVRNVASPASAYDARAGLWHSYYPHRPGGG